MSHEDQFKPNELNSNNEVLIVPLFERVFSEFQRKTLYFFETNTLPFLFDRLLEEIDELELELLKIAANGETDPVSEVYLYAELGDLFHFLTSILGMDDGISAQGMLGLVREFMSEDGAEQVSGQAEIEGTQQDFYQALIYTEHLQQADQNLLESTIANLKKTILEVKKMDDIDDASIVDVARWLFTLEEIMGVDGVKVMLFKHERNLKKYQAFWMNLMYRLGIKFKTAMKIMQKVWDWRGGDRKHIDSWLHNNGNSAEYFKKKPAEGSNPHAVGKSAMISYHQA